MCRPRANRVYLWAAQRPYPASMGNISCYKGTELSSDTSQAHIQYKTVPVTPTQNITSAQGCFLLLVRPSRLCGVLTGSGVQECVHLFDFLLFIVSVLLFWSLKERPNNVKNGCSGSTDDSELNTTPDGQVLQVLFSPPKAFINTEYLMSRLNVIWPTCKVNQYVFLLICWITVTLVHHSTDQPCAKHPSSSSVCQP